MRFWVLYGEWLRVRLLPVFAVGWGGVGGVAAEWRRSGGEGAPGGWSELFGTFRRGAACWAGYENGFFLPIFRVRVRGGSEEASRKAHSLLGGGVSSGSGLATRVGM
ncbi:hypothetical protein B9T39_05250 [Alloscardovia macacae]|uniref:Uncharacterized protein n=1 Tax=Alloscardovia macacae TaxID=1160091 RepID=A0A1Y2T1P4_9BIFI|nr:hypothetical protein B9T39_05250 [Alloscardovia macacae]